MMSFESVEKALRDTKAVKNYEPVLTENESLKAENQGLRQEAIEREERYSNQIRALKEENSELQSHRIRYKRDSYTPQEFSKLVSNEVEKAHMERIKKGIETKWAMEAPVRTKEALKRELSLGIDGCAPEIRAIIEQHAAKRVDAMLRDRASWPKWFIDLHEGIVRQGVQSGLDATFNSRVDEAANKEIAYRANIAWPKFIMEKVAPQFQASLISQLRKLCETIIVSCNKCGNEYQVNLTPDEISTLIKEPYLYCRCLNPSCRDLFGPHYFPITLSNFIYHLIKTQS